MLVLLVGLIGGNKTVEVNPDSTTYHVLAAQVIRPIATPLIMVPGTYGTQNRFDSFDFPLLLHHYTAFIR